MADDSLADPPKPTWPNFPVPPRWGTAVGDVPKTPWREIPRWKKRVVVQCNHASAAADAPRTEIGGVTRADAVDHEGEDMPLSLRKYDIDMRCPSCGRIWRVPLASLGDVARQRGNRLVRRLVQELPGVSLAPSRTGTG